MGLRHTKIMKINSIFAPASIKILVAGMGFLNFSLEEIFVSFNVSGDEFFKCVIRLFWNIRNEFELISVI